jgi:hypothetical protein
MREKMMSLLQYAVFYHNADSVMTLFRYIIDQKSLPQNDENASGKNINSTESFLMIVYCICRG